MRLHDSAHQELAPHHLAPPATGSRLAKTSAKTRQPTIRKAHLTEIATLGLLPCPSQPVRFQQRQPLPHLSQKANSVSGGFHQTGFLPACVACPPRLPSCLLLVSRPPQPWVRR